jgi:hypothetical protein
MAKKIKFNYLTNDLHKLLLEIKASKLDTGYGDLIDFTIKTRKYHPGDKKYLQLVRNNWVKHLKSQRNKKRIYKIFLENE